MLKRIVFMNIVAILANGIGSRFKSKVPKQFHKVNGKMVIEHVIESICDSCKTDKIIIATNIEANSVYLADLCLQNDIDMIEGGSTRNKTLKNVINHISDNYKCSRLIVCDAVRPMITGELIDNYFEFLTQSDAVVTAQKITDSLGCYDFHCVDRERYYLMQSPEGFRFPLLKEHFDENSPLTEVTQQLPQDSKIHLYFDFSNNFKLTYPADLKYLEALVTARDNDVDFSNILENVSRLNMYLKAHYPKEVESWSETLENFILRLLKEWQITRYSVIKKSHFGIIFIAKSVKYGKCVLKIIPPFIDRYEGERSCYQKISARFMCELYDYNDTCSAILLERCQEAELDLDANKEDILDFFEKVINCKDIAVSDNVDRKFKNYSDILNSKINESNFDYKNSKIMSYVEKAVKIFNESFDKDNFTLIHGDLHRYNIMKKNDKLLAIDPIGYIAPKEVDIARFIGTELCENCESSELRKDAEKIIDIFSAISNESIIKKILYVDMVFRLHNSLFENEDYVLTDKWLSVLDSIGNYLIE